MTEFNAEMFARMTLRLTLEHKDHGGWQEADTGTVCARDAEIVTPNVQYQQAWYDKLLPTRCWCGQTLHYSSESERRRIQELVDGLGRFQPVQVLGVGSFLVDRHYVALHGIKGSEVQSLGFEKVD